MNDKRITFFLMLGFVFLISSCVSDDRFSSTTNIEARTISNKTRDTIFYVEVEGSMVPIYVSIPNSCANETYPAMVVLHGSDGMWKNNKPESGVLLRQFEEWRELLGTNCFVSAFVDSYSPRGCEERSGKWKIPPDNFKISSQFVRSKDANAAFSLLSNLKFSNKQKVVNKENIGLLGFSDGGTALAATLFDEKAIPSDWEWRQKFDGKEYDVTNGVKAPAERPVNEGFSVGVIYYGGSGGNDYWGGSPCGDNYFYKNYAPILYQIPSEGYLTDNTLCAVEYLKSVGSEVELNIYQGADHGFDDDGTSHSEKARTNTIEWLKKEFSKN